MAKQQNYEKRDLFEQRLAHHHDELRWLYMELYDNGSMFAELCDQMRQFWKERSKVLKQRDAQRLEEADWYKSRDLLGMMLYIDRFAGNMKGVEKKLDYLTSAGVNCLHLMPFLDTVEGRSDGGYAVADFRTVRKDLGGMEDLEQLTTACHKKGINVCMDFVMNHTSCDHDWAKRALAGDGEYMSRYFFFDNEALVQEYEKTVPQVFPTTAPGNFTKMDNGYWVMTTFYPYQWDLNYRNPRVFNEMMYNFLYLANRGIDIMRIDAVPYIWKELGTSCRNLPRVHTIVRLMRMIGEIVCPSVILLGEVVMEPVKVTPYFGTAEKPECHLLYNVTSMCTIWNTLATHDARLLKGQLDSVGALPKEFVFLNYLRCHDDIGWGLDYDTLASWGMQQTSHKQYLNDFFLGRTPGSASRGQLYNDDIASGDARLCGTTASLCGLETAKTQEEYNQAVGLDLMLHSMMMFQSGIPMLYSGDEVGQLNDYSYEQNPHYAEDSRYLHRGQMRWDLVEQAKDTTTPAGRIFSGLNTLTQLRRKHPAFDADAPYTTLDTPHQSLLAIQRHKEGQTLVGAFNFDLQPRSLELPQGEYRCLQTGKEYPCQLELAPYQGLWLEQV